MEHVDESPFPGESGLALDGGGVAYQRLGTHVRARWDQVLGVVALPADAPRRAFLLLPRRPPAPPWVELGPRELPAGFNPDEKGFERFVRVVRERSAHRDYRAGTRGAQLSPETLMDRVLARTEVPGALEVPVGAGPGGWWRRSLDLIAGGSAGGLFGLYAGMLTGAGAVALGVAAAAGAAAGATLPVAASKSFGFRRRSRRPRVLVLAPDGCVVGLPTGPRAYGWGQIGAFRAGEHQLPGLRPRLCLEVELASGQVAGRIDASWFGDPLELIVSVAEAYRKRQR
ncbi:MAG: hypothetical protein AAF447_10830 [Myxococcota bacterium]